MAKTSEAAETPAGLRLDRSASHLLHRALQHALDIYGTELGDGALTQRQFAVLSAVAADEGVTQTGLVRATGIDRSTLAELVARMIAKNLLVRERSSVDARANVVRLSEAGRAALAEATPRVKAADARILTLLPAKSRDTFVKLLAAMSAAAEAGEPEVEAAAEAPAEAGPKKRRKKDKVEKARAEKDKAEKGEKKRKKKARKAGAAAEPESEAA